MLYPASQDDLGLMRTTTFLKPGDLKGRHVPEEASTSRPCLPRLEDMRKPARKGKHVVTLLFGISNFQSCITAIYTVFFSLPLGSLLTAR